ncbi:MAG: hypothetical protein KC543_16025, partial [Myxococcales bacterium]|nr:hypothetical protein [Myxococcales bacterium]
MARRLRSPLVVLALLATAWIGGLLVGAAEPGLVGPVPLVIALTIATTLAAVGQELHARAWLGVCAACAFIAGAAFRAPPSPPPPVPGGIARFEAVIERVRYGQRWPDASAPDRAAPEDVVSARVRLIDGERLTDHAPLPAGATVWLGGPIASSPGLSAGARIRGLARFSMRQTFDNPSPHPPWPDPERPSAGGWVPSQARLVIVDAPPLRAWLSAVRARARAALDRTLPPRAAGLARALVLGDAGAVADDDRDALRGAGIAHLLAV